MTSRPVIDRILTIRGNVLEAQNAFATLAGKREVDPMQRGVWAERSAACHALTERILWAMRRLDETISVDDELPAQPSAHKSTLALLTQARESLTEADRKLTALILYEPAKDKFRGQLNSWVAVLDDLIARASYDLGTCRAQMLAASHADTQPGRKGTRTCPNCDGDGRVVHATAQYVSVRGCERCDGHGHVTAGQAADA